MSKNKFIEITCTPMNKCAGNDVDKITLYPDMYDHSVDMNELAKRIRQDIVGAEDIIEVRDTVLRVRHYRNIRVCVKEKDESSSRSR